MFNHPARRRTGLLILLARMQVPSRMISCPTSSAMGPHAWPTPHCSKACAISRCQVRVLCGACHERGLTTSTPYLPVVAPPPTNEAIQHTPTGYGWACAHAHTPMHAAPPCTGAGLVACATSCNLTPAPRAEYGPQAPHSEPVWEGGSGGGGSSAQVMMMTDAWMHVLHTAPAPTPAGICYISLSIMSNGPDWMRRKRNADRPPYPTHG